MDSEFATIPPVDLAPELPELPDSPAADLVVKWLPVRVDESATPQTKGVGDLSELRPRSESPPC